MSGRRLRGVSALPGGGRRGSCRWVGRLRGGLSRGCGCGWAGMRGTCRGFRLMSGGDQVSVTPMLDAVKQDLADLQIDRIPGGRTYQATALHLARVIDKRGEDEGPSVTAKLAEQLTKVMLLLTRKGGDGDDGGTFEAFTDAVSTPSMGG